jgi:hypothetical protein
MFAATMVAPSLASSLTTLALFSLALGCATAAPAQRAAPPPPPLL